MAFKLPQIDKKLSLVGLIGVLLAIFILFGQGNQISEEERYQLSQKEHNQIALSLKEKTKNVLDLFAEEKFAEVEGKNKEIIADTESLLAKEDELISLSQSLDLKEENEQYRKRRLAEEAMLVAYEKIEECVQFKLAEEFEALEKCDEEAGPLFDRLNILTEQYKKQFK